ncbi:GDSL-type esterase/lipase family protein [Enterobacter cloacae]
MATTPTNLPVPSESPIDLKFNAGKIDEYVTSMGWTYTDRFGVKHYTIEGVNYLAQQVMNAFGYVPLTGVTFTTGATLNNPNEVLFNTADNSYYKWTGSFAVGPKVVPANSTPESTGGIGPGKWLSVGDAVLRGQVSAKDGFKLIGSCSSMTELRTVVPEYDGQKILLLGYYADRPASKLETYVWSATSTATDDGGRVVAANGVTTGRWIIQQSGNVFDARVFGIRPEATYSGSMTDSAAMFAKAQASVGTNGVIHFPLPDGWTSAHYLIDAAYSYNWAQSWISSDPGVVIHNGATNDDEGKKPRLKSDVVFNQTTPTSTSTYTTERGSNSYDLKSGISAAMAAAGLNIHNKEIPISFSEYVRAIRIDNTNLTYSDFSTGMNITPDQISWSDAAAAGTAWHGVEMAAADGVEIETMIQNRQAISSGIVMAGVRAMTSGSTGAGGIVSMRFTIGDATVRFYNGDNLTKSITQYNAADWINSADNGAVRVAVRISNNGKSITWLINGSPVYTHNTGSTFVHTIVFAANQAARAGVTFQFAYSRVRDFVQYTKPVRIACLGDSITRGARTSNEWPRLLEAYGEHLPGIGCIRSVDNLAVSGWRSLDIVNNLSNYDFTKYDYVLVLIGTNDCQAVLPTGANNAMSVLATNITTIGNAIVAANPQCIPIFGMFYKWTNRDNSGGGNQTFNLQYIANFQSTLRWIVQGNGWDVAFVDDHFGENYGYIGSFPPSGVSPFWTNDNLHPNTHGDIAVAAAFASALSRKISIPGRGAYCRMIPLINGFTKKDEATNGVMKVTKTGNVVTISGAITGGTASTIFGSLPVWARPEDYRVFSVPTIALPTESAARLVVQPDGNMYIGSGYLAGGAYINVTYTV